MDKAIKDLLEDICQSCCYGTSRLDQKLYNRVAKMLDDNGRPAGRWVEIALNGCWQRAWRLSDQSGMDGEVRVQSNPESPVRVFPIGWVREIDA